MQTELRKAFNKAGTTLPEKFSFGFEKYATVQAAPYATKKLNYQLGAIQWLMEKLAENQPKALLNIRRELIGVEKGPPPVPTTKKKRGRGGNKSLGLEDSKILETMPVELTFTASESSMRNFLQAMANSKEYLYAIRTLRIRNENQNAPGPKDADFQTKSSIAVDREVTPFEGNDVFGGFSVPGEVGEDGEAIIDGAASEDAREASIDPDLDDEYILKQVMGDENILVHIKFDILLMKGQKPSASEDDVKGKGQSKNK
ncbi:MAG: Amuc_1100 family pilus-like protein, partial [Akkermansiaceae bacterium]